MSRLDKIEHNAKFIKEADQHDRIWRDILALVAVARAAQDYRDQPCAATYIVLVDALAPLLEDRATSGEGDSR